MNIEYKRIDDNNFVVLNERGDETFYHIDGNIEDWEITGFVFLQNEIEWKMKELIELTQNKHDLKMNLLHLRKYLLSMKRINYKINNTSKNINMIVKSLNSFKTESNLNETKRINNVNKKKN